MGQGEPDRRRRVERIGKILIKRESQWCGPPAFAYRSERLRALEDAGTSLADVVRTRIFLLRIDDWREVAPIHGEFFGEIRPACTVMQVSRFIDPLWLVEMEADAILTGDE